MLPSLRPSGGSPAPQPCLPASDLDRLLPPPTAAICTAHCRTSTPPHQIRVGELQAWEDTSGYMVVGFMPQCPYVLDLSAGAGGPLTISITDTAISGGATQVRA